MIDDVDRLWNDANKSPEKAAATVDVVFVAVYFFTILASKTAISILASKRPARKSPEFISSRTNLNI